MERALALLREHGRETISFQTLEPGLERFWTEDDDACVAYQDVSSAWVAAGSPIASGPRARAAMAEFSEAARQAGRRVRFFGVEDGDLGPEFSTMTIGVQPSWDPTTWGEVLVQKRSLREQLRRARAKGVTVRAVAASALGPGSPIRAQMDRLLARWRGSRSMPAMSFLVHIDLYGHREQRRYFVAETERGMCGFLIAVPVYARDGWFFEDVVRDPAAPNGTVELLIDAAMTTTAAEGSRWVSYGLAPLFGINSPILRSIRDSTRWLYNFRGVHAFKAKLAPDAWHPVYLAYPAGERGVLAIVDTLRAFAGGSLLRFAAATARHRAPLLVWLLALCLVPWTALLAAAPTAAWFPSPAVKAAWIAYDHLLFAGLTTLAWRWSTGLARTLAVLAGLDFVLGAVQTAVFNAGRASGVIDGLLIAVSLIAPACACAFLWWTAERRGHATVTATM